jgi:hypothetical protein
LKKLPGFKSHPINSCIKKDCAKVVDSVDIEDIGDKVIIHNKNKTG